MRAFAGLWLFLFIGVGESQTPAQNATDTLSKANVVALNVQTAVKAHLLEDADFHPAKQIPEQKLNPPNVLIRKDGSFYFDQTPGQQSRSLMEDLRQGVHALQSANKIRGLDTVALAGAREYWPKLRDISCREAPETRYYDLDGVEQYCPSR